MVIKAYVWVYDGPAPWHFATIEKASANKLLKNYNLPRRGFGAIAVNVTIGKTQWKTSIFPDKDGSYLLPLKKEVRKKEGVKSGDFVSLSIKLNI